MTRGQAANEDRREVGEENRCLRRAAALHSQETASKMFSSVPKSTAGSAFRPCVATSAAASRVSVPRIVLSNFSDLEGDCLRGGELGASPFCGGVTTSSGVCSSASCAGVGSE